MNTDELRFDGRVALITGAGAGMGRVHAEFLAARGAHVVVSDWGTAMNGKGSDPSVAQAAVDALRASGGQASMHSADLMTESGARSAVRKALDTQGRLDIIIHNAGFSRSSPIHDAPMEDLDDLWAVNTRAAVAMLREAWPAMVRQEFGRIVLIGSTAMYGIGDSVYYSTVKASYLGLVRSLAETGQHHGIKTNLVGPSGATRMAAGMPASEFRNWFLRTMRNELVTALVAYLAHEDAVPNGETFAAAGGRVARIVMGENRGIVDPDLTVEKVRDAMQAILADSTFEPYPDYASSAESLMNALGYSPTESLSSGAFSPPARD